MATQKDVQDLLRLLTTGRNKVSMMDAMKRVKALQGAGLRSISDIASSNLPTLTTALSDEKAAKSLLTACKKPTDTTSAKRSSSSSLPSSKRTKSAYSLEAAPQTPQELEASLALPQPSADEEAISKCTIYTNRAPLVLAFAVQLLKYTMPEQPLSSRLSLAQAVVSANSRSKAVSIGLEKGKSAEEEGWGQGQPKVKVMGREISVLKRTGYEWKEEDTKSENANGEDVKLEGEDEAIIETQSTLKEEEAPASTKPPSHTGWTVSTPITSKKSTFVARSITVNSPTQARNLLSALLSAQSELRTADHNIWAFRTSFHDDSADDGESGGGRHLLRLLQADNLTNVLLVVTRWYGGIMLGPDRWRIMSQVSRDALSQRLRVSGTLGREALWGLDLEAMKTASAGAMPVHRPESARTYILKAFGGPPEDGGAKKKKTLKEIEQEKEENLGLLLEALDMLFASWNGHTSREELDMRAWGWYVAVRPEVESGVAGWGGKGEVKLSKILDLRRKG